MYPNISSSTAQPSAPPAPSSTTTTTATTSTVSNTTSLNPIGFSSMMPQPVNQNAPNTGAQSFTSPYPTGQSSQPPYPMGAPPASSYSNNPPTSNNQAANPNKYSSYTLPQVGGNQAPPTQGGASSSQQPPYSQQTSPYPTTNLPGQQPNYSMGGQASYPPPNSYYPQSGGMGYPNPQGSNAPPNQPFGNQFGSNAPPNQQFGNQFGSNAPPNQPFGNQFGSNAPPNQPFGNPYGSNAPQNPPFGNPYGSNPPPNQPFGNPYGSGAPSNQPYSNPYGANAPSNQPYSNPYGQNTPSRPPYQNSYGPNTQQSQGSFGGYPFNNQTQPPYSNPFSNQPLAGGGYNSNTPMSPAMSDRIRAIAGRYEIGDALAQRLNILQQFEIVVLCDDSGSMNTPVDGTSGTRWDELRSIVQIVIEIGSVFDANGVDVHFLNRAPILNVTDPRQVVEAFIARPSGLTPLTPALRRIFQSTASKPGSDKRLLVFVATDGAPTDANGADDVKGLENLMRRERQANTTYVTFLACTDDDSSVAYLSQWDKTMTNVDVVDDYKSEREEVRRVRGHNYPFSFGDYVVKALLGAVDPQMDMLDEVGNNNYYRKY